MSIPRPIGSPYISSAIANIKLSVDNIETVYKGVDYALDDVYITARFNGKPHDSVPSVTILREQDWELVDWYSQNRKLKFFSVKNAGATWKYIFRFEIQSAVCKKKYKVTKPKEPSHLRKFNNLIVDDV